MTLTALPTRRWHALLFAPLALLLLYKGDGLLEGGKAGAGALFLLGGVVLLWMVVNRYKSFDPRAVALEARDAGVFIDVGGAHSTVPWSAITAADFQRAVYRVRGVPMGMVNVLSLIWDGRVHDFRHFQKMRPGFQQPEPDGFRALADEIIRRASPARSPASRA